MRGCPSRQVVRSTDEEGRRSNAVAGRRPSPRQPRQARFAPPVAVLAPPVRAALAFASRGSSPDVTSRRFRPKSCRYTGSSSSA